MSAFDYLVFYKYIPILYTSTNPIVEQISNRIAYTCEHSNFRPVLSSKINSSSSFDDGALLDELFFVGVGLGAALLGDGDDAAGTHAEHAEHAEDPASHLLRVAEMAAQVASSEPAATQALDTVDHLTRLAEMAAQVVSLEPAATQVLAIAVEMVGVAAVVAAVHD